MGKLDLNRAPYFDDFEPKKNFMKVLYQPGRPVQARELNQVQSIFQHQIESFANHIFKNGSKVSNARTSLQSKAYVRLTGTPVVSTYPENTRLLGETSGITATLVRGVDVEGDDPATLYVVYTGTAIDGETSVFIPGENIRILDVNSVEVGTVTVRCPSCPGSGLNDTLPPTGWGQFFTVDEGIFYFEGMFLDTTRQDIIVVKYLEKNVSGDIVNFTPCKLGLDFVQNIVTYQDDNSLLDPSLGYPNSTAPGADRYQAKLVLTKRSYNFEDGENFIPLCRLGPGMTVEFMKTDSEYADLMDTIAKRTYETNGDYTIRPFKVSFFNAKKSTAADSLGWSVDGDEDSLVSVVTPSVAYVKGYRVETISDTPVVFKKARDTNKMSSFVKHFDGRSYILGVPKGAGIWAGANNAGMMTDATVVIYDQPTTGNAAAGTPIGTLKISDAAYVSGNLTTKEATYRYYVYDIAMNAGKKLSDARSFVVASSGFYTNAVIDSVTSSVELYNANQTALIYKVDRQDVKSLRSSDDPLNGAMNVVIRRKLNGVADGSGSVTFTTSANEYFDNAGSSMLGWYVAGGVTTSFIPGPLTAFSPTSITVALGSGAAGASVYVIIDVLKTNQTERTKTPQNLTVTTNTAPDTAIGAEIVLGVTDAYRLKSVKLFVEGSPDTPVADITDEYKINSNITDTAYRESKIVRTKAPSFSTNNSYRLAINFDYFEHSGSQGFFTVDSYAPALNADDSGVTYETLGGYTASSGVVYPLSASIDFRPDILGTNPVTSVLPANESTAIFDIEYYLARTDLLQINKDGFIYVKKGEPSDDPRPPKTDDNAMALYEIWLSPYTYSLNDVRTKFIENRRYTMRDIGSLEKRIENVEYYTTLSLLEKSAQDMSIKDANGLDRFKNGLIADNFSDFQAADLTNTEFKAAADRTKAQLRPSFKLMNRKLVFNAAKSSGFQLSGNMAHLPFTESVAVEQPYATKHLSVNPYLQYNQEGQMVMSPNNDTWSDTTMLPQLITNIDANVEAIKTIVEQTPNPAPNPVVEEKVLAVDWGTHVDLNTTVLNKVETKPVTGGGGRGGSPWRNLNVATRAN
ncbi:hypothetical protein [Xanthomonas phage X1]|nr:hypothetical protein [Xanthomonas phage X1]